MAKKITNSRITKTSFKKGTVKTSNQKVKSSRVLVKTYPSNSQMWQAQRRHGRRFIVVGNWKMHLGDQHGLKLVEQIVNKYQTLKPAPLIILCPPFTVLKEVNKLLSKVDINLGAQDVAGQSEGAHTGEISAAMLAAAGCKYVIIGHSERRQQLSETDTLIKQKLAQAVQHGLTPILCVGETWEQRQEDRAEATVIYQLQQALSDLIIPPKSNLLIAYEPVWAIGSGNPVSQNEAAHMAQLINHLVVDGQHFNFTCAQPADQIKVLYGGSVEVNNIKQFDMPGIIDGVLVGGASLMAEKFMALSKLVS